LESALIVSCKERRIAFFTGMLKSISCEKIVTAETCGQARRLLLERDFDLCIIDAPLSDESGELLSRHIAAKGVCQVLLCVAGQYYDEVSAIVEDFGVITVAKPIDESLFWSALKLAKASQSKMKRLQTENSKLMKKIEDIRIIDRAKCLLIETQNVTEQDAHKYIEKQAMDLRITKRAVAEGIIASCER